MSPKSLNERLLNATRWGFWTRLKLPPHHAVRWEPVTHDDGRQSFRGKNWVEVLPHGEDREPRRYFGADVETAGPHEWLSYYPGANEPVCGWGRPRLPDGEMQYCPQHRAKGVAFCVRHMAELNSSEGEESNGRTGSGQA